MDNVLYQSGENHVITYVDMVTPETLHDLQKRHPKARIVSEGSAWGEINALNYEKYVNQPPKAITYEHWFDMLDILPPCRWQDYGPLNAFFVSERITDNIVTWYARRITAEGVECKQFNLNADASSETIITKFNEVTA